MPEIKDEHICGKAVASSVPIDDEWQEAEEELKQRKALEAFVLQHNQVSCNQVLNLAVADFSGRNRKELREYQKQWSVFNPFL